MELSTSSSRILHPSDNGTGERQFYLVCDIGGVEENMVWTAVSRFKKVEGRDGELYYLEPLAKK